MRSIHLPRILLTCFLFLNMANLQAQTKTKHALIFAIGNYPEKNGWNKISSLNDVPYIRTVLEKQDFRPENITIVRDSAATRQGIENSFKALVSRVQPGDIVVIHFSSHGEQVADNNNKEETDGLDETIVSYDAVHPKMVKDFEADQANYFRDDQFGVYMEQLRSKLGGNGDVIVFIDACHSGSGTRGSKKVRGGAPPLVPKNFKAPKDTTSNAADVFLEKSTARGETKNLATYVVISGSRAEENNYETTNDEGADMGSLTYAISKVFEGLVPGTTYRSLFAGILSVLNQVADQQHPVIEGNGLDRVLFAGEFKEQKAYIEIKEVNGNTITLNAGIMAGLDNGAKVALYPSRTYDPAKATLLASGIISEAESFRSKVILDKAPGIKAADGWVFITEPVYKIQPLVIRIDPGTRGSAGKNFSGSEATAIKNVLKEIPIVKLEGNPELLLVKGAGTDSLKIAANGYLFCTISNTDELKEQIRKYTQYKFLQKLELKDPGCNLEVRMVPFIKGKPDTVMMNKKTINGILEFNETDSVVIWAINKGKKPVYLNILDMQPDGIINPIFPNKQKEIYATDLLIEPGKEWWFEREIQLCPPYGMEIFKIFVSQSEIDMEIIAESSGKKRGGNFSVLQELVGNSYNTATRGGKVGNSKAEGTVYNLIFRIKPGKNKCE